MLIPAKAWGFIGYAPNSYTPQLPRLLNDINASKGSGSLYYWHTLVPHYPYIFNGDETKHKRINTSFISSGDSAAVYANYRKQVQYADRSLGRFVLKLKTENLYDNSVIIVTADHGLRNESYHNTEHVPMMIRVPGLQHRWSDVEYQHIDFVPTLLSLLGITLGPDDLLPGKSALR